MKVRTKKVTITGMNIIKGGQMLPTWQTARLRKVYNKWGCVVAKYICYRHMILNDEGPSDFIRDYARIK